jgi:transposase-like protein
MPARLKLTDDLHQKVVKAIEVGAPYRAVCESLGIGERTLYRWLQEGAAADEAMTEAPPGYRENAATRRKRLFWQDVTRARAAAHVAYAALLRRYAQEGDPRSVMFWLERRHPQEWGKRDRLDLASTAADETPDLTDVVRDDPEVLDLIDALRDRIAQAQADDDGSPS